MCVHGDIAFAVGKKKIHDCHVRSTPVHFFFFLNDPMCTQPSPRKIVFFVLFCCKICFTSLPCPSFGTYHLQRMAPVMLSCDSYSIVREEGGPCWATAVLVNACVEKHTGYEHLSVEYLLLVNILYPDVYQYYPCVLKLEYEWLGLSDQHAMMSTYITRPSSTSTVVLKYCSRASW